jgi:CheY-like chemotaxis protein
VLALDMPVMDGFGAVAALRHVGCSAPVIALAEPARRGAARALARFGFDALLLKPIDRMTC